MRHVYECITSGAGVKVPDRTEADLLVSKMPDFRERLQEAFSTYCDEFEMPCRPPSVGIFVILFARALRTHARFAHNTDIASECLICCDCVRLVFFSLCQSTQASPSRSSARDAKSVVSAASRRTYDSIAFPKSRDMHDLITPDDSVSNIGSGADEGEERDLIARSSHRSRHGAFDRQQTGRDDDAISIAMSTGGRSESASAAPKQTSRSDARHTRRGEYDERLATRSESPRRRS